MSTETRPITPLPAGFTWGHVTGRIIHALGDTAADPDKTPEARGAAGTVTFTPLSRPARAHGVLVMHERVTVTLDADGYLVDAHGERQPVALLVGAYSVGFSLTGGQVTGFSIEVSEAHTVAAPLDLATVAPYTPPTGVTVTTLVVPASPSEGYALGWQDGKLAWLPGGGGGGVTDHGLLTGLGDDDHPQYALADGTRGAFVSPAALTSGLAGKADADHDHAISDVTGLQDALDGKQAAGSYAAATHTHTASQVSDSTATGRSVLTAADAAAARTAIGAGTSDLAIGTTATTAKAGNYAPPSASTTVQGVVELATNAEATTGTDTTRAVTPAGLKAVADTKAPASHTHAYADLTGKPTLGTAAATASTDYATAAQGAKADTALQPATGQVINAQTGTAYTLAAADAGKLVTLTNAAAITLTVPGNVFTAGQRVDCIVAGAGMVTAVGSSCTVNGTPSLVSRAQWSAFTVLFTSATTAVLVGDLA